MPAEDEAAGNAAHADAAPSADLLGDQILAAIRTVQVPSHLVSSGCVCDECWCACVCLSVLVLCNDCDGTWPMIHLMMQNLRHHGNAEADAICAATESSLCDARSKALKLNGIDPRAARSSALVSTLSEPSNVARTGLLY